MSNENAASFNPTPNTSLSSSFKGSSSSMSAQRKNVAQFPPEYITMIVENLNGLNESFQEIASGLHGSSNGGGGGNMDDLKRRVENLEKKTDKMEESIRGIDSKVSVIQERLNNIPTSADLLNTEMRITNAITDAIKSVPTEDRIKTVIRDVIKDDDVAKKTYVKEQVTSAKLWIVGSIIFAIVLAIVRFGFK
ncbi:hypothetical protein [Aneurinibacillus soli]|nr:hypothetical protein [Aneurinibacillus soli]